MIFSSSPRSAVAPRGRKAAQVSAMRNAVLRRVNFPLTMSDSGSVLAEARNRLAKSLDASRLKTREPLAQYTTFRIGGPADLFYEATSADDLADAVTAARETGIRHFVLGLGANILIGDKGFR